MSKRTHYLILVLLVIAYTATMAYLSIRNRAEASTDLGPIVPPGQAIVPRVQTAGVVLTTFESAIESMRHDNALLITAPRLDGSYYFESDEAMVWYVPIPDAPSVGTQSFACYRLYELEDSNGGMDNFVQCGPVHSEDRFDGQAVFYITVPELEYLFEAGAYAMQGPG